MMALRVVAARWTTASLERSTHWYALLSLMRTPVSSQATTFAAQVGDGSVALGREGCLGTAQHIHQAALADRQPEKIGEGALQTLVGQGLERLQIGCHRMSAWSEGGAPSPQPAPERSPASHRTGIASKAAGAARQRDGSREGQSSRVR